MDYDCSGVLTNNVELPAFLDNMRTQPPCGRGGGDGGGRGPGGGAGAESWTESSEGYEDVPGLAAAAAEFADSPVGQDLAELLCCLQ